MQGIVNLIPKSITTPPRWSSNLQAEALWQSDDVNGDITALVRNVEKNITDIYTNTSNIITKLPKSPYLSGETRELDVPFMVSADYPAMVFYRVGLDVTAPLLGTDDAIVELYCDDNNPPVVLQDRAYIKSSQLLGLVGVGLETVEFNLLFHYVMPGEYVLLQTSGSGVKTLEFSKELIFNV